MGEIITVDRVKGIILVVGGNRNLKTFLKGGATMGKNEQLMREYKDETGKEATFIHPGDVGLTYSAFYVEWLEHRAAAKSVEAVAASTNTQSVGIA